MSKTVDERVVEMRFDNKQFESNVQTTMSTLDKLKQKLNFTGASKGLQDIGSATKKVDMAGLGTAVETVTARFSALQVMGVTALANITNSAVNTGKKMISALTIDPIKTGFQEYETQINAVQTILANTSAKGTTIDQVNAALDELNKYADMTIYNFTEMTRNIGTFTAAGIDLETSVSAIQGIANLAAVSGSNSQQASTAMYQLSQALAAGTVKLMDWNSVVNAGMGGQVFQDALKETSALLGTGAEAAIKAEGSFRESLSTGWLTAEVLTETLKKFTTSGANEYVAEYTGLSKEAVEAALEEAEARYGEADAIKYASKALAEKSGKNADEIEQALTFAKNANDAATKVKTFTQLWDVLKESVQSGWSQTWKILVGDFEEAKDFLTPLSDFLTGVINKFSEARNKLLESAFTKNFTAAFEKIKNLTEPIKKSADSIKEVVKTVEEYANVVNEIIGGKWGNGQERWDKLTQAGYDWAHAQNLVNEKLGDSTRHATDYKEAQEGVAEAQGEMSKSTVKRITELATMSNAELKSLGYTKDQIKAFRELAGAAEKTGIPLEEFIENIDEIDGRYLILNGLKNIGMSIVTIFKSIGQAWKDAFPPMQADQLFNIIAGFHKFTTKLVISEETAKNLTRTLKGVFAIIDIITTILGGGFKIALKLVSSILGYFNLDILQVTALVGDAIVKFRDWFEGLFDVSKVLDIIVPAVRSAGKAVKGWIESFKNLPIVQKIIGKITEAFEELKKLDLKEIGKNIIEGLKNGLSGGAGEVIDQIIQIAQDLIAKFCAILGIHSPSKEFEEIGGNIIEGLKSGLQNGISAIFEFFSGLGSKIMELLGQINWGKVFAVLISTGMLYTVNQIAKALGTLATPFAGLGSMMESVGGVLSDSTKQIKKILKSTSKVMNSFAFSIKAKALRNIALSLLMLVGAVAVLTFLDTKKLWNSVLVIGALAVILGVLAIAVDKMSKSAVAIEDGNVKINNLSGTLLGIGLALLAMAAVVKIIGSMNINQAIQGFVGLGVLVAIMAGVFAIFGKFVKGDQAKYMDKAGKMLTKMSIALLIMVAVAKLVAKLSPAEIVSGIGAMVVFGIFISALVAASYFGGEHASKLGTMLLKISIAMGIMVGVIKLIGGLSDTEMERGGIAMIAFTAFVAALAGISHFSSEISSVGKAMLAISLSLAILVGVMKLIGFLSPGDMIKGGIAIAAFAGLLYLLVQTLKPMKSYVAKMAGTLIALSVSIGILAFIAVLLSLVDTASLAKGITAVGMLGAIMALMILATKDAKNCKGNLIVMTVAIGVMAAAVAALSFIDGKKLAGATVAMSLLMGMFALMAKSSSNITSSLSSMIIMTVVVGLLAGILWLLSGLPVESTLAVAASLSLLMLSLSASMAIISTAGSMAISAILPLGLMVVIMGLIGGILYLLKDLPVESTMTNAISLSILLITLTAVTAALGLIAPLVPGAMTAVLGLGVVIAELALVLAALGGLAQIPGLQWLISEGGNFLQTIGTAIGQFVGGIIGGIAQGVTSTLPQIGTDLSTFMTNVQPFIDSAQNIKPEMMQGVKTLAEAILIITGANLLEQITSWLTGGNSLADFGTQLASFGDGMKAYSDAVSGINTEAITASATAAKGLAEVAKSIPASGDSIWGLLAGEQNLGTFGTQLAMFGRGMKVYSAEVTGINTEAITNSVTAAKGLVEVANAIPKNGHDIWSLLAGENNIGTFGTQLVPFGEGLKLYSTTVAGVDTEAINASVTAAKGLVKVANTIPKNGHDIWSVIAGEQDLGTFGNQLTSFGKSLKKYSKAVVGIDAEAITASVKAAKGLVKVANAIPDGNSFWDKLTGKQDLGDFGNKLVPFGKGLKKYSNAVVDVDSGAISNSVSSAKKLSKFISELGDIDVSGVSSFKSAISSLAETNIDGFVKAFSASTSSLASVGSNLINGLVKGIKSRQSAVTSSAKSIADTMTKAFTSKSSQFNKVGVSLMSKFISGISKSKSKVKSAATSALSSAVTGMRSYYTSFYNAGSYLVSGFARGISANTYLATARAREMARAAEQAAKDELKINSPSKVFMKIGAGVPEGFVKGIESLSGTVTKSVTTMADSAIKNTKTVMSRIADAINSDIDAKPTIAPVMDLSSVESGVGAINGMLGNSSFGVSANLNSISTMMNRRLQNGSNDDVVSAIDKLRKSLGNVGNTNYNINGITYDDGSNISEAVKLLIRAARVERRI